MHLTLRQAEQHVHASKSTILRAIRTGKLSADRDGPEGSYRIDPAELFRVFPPKSAGSSLVPEVEPEQVTLAEGEAVALAKLMAENEKLAALLDAERRRGEELREERDAWKGQAERLALTHHVAPAPPAPIVEAAEKPVQADTGRPNFLERLGRALRG